MENMPRFEDLVGQPESLQLEYKATLIPSKVIAQILAGFANARGGTLIFGVREQPPKKLEVQGLSNDFNVLGMVNKAMTLMQPTPSVESGYFTHQGKQLFGIQVKKSQANVLVEGKHYERQDALTVNLSITQQPTVVLTIPRFQTMKKTMETQQINASEAKKRLLEHYQNILNIYEPSLSKLFPLDIIEKTAVPEGKILNRILYASCVDNFETYLSDLLYQIYIARPDTLKGGDATVRVAEVLDRTDIEDFVQWYAGKRVSKLQKGSIKGFLDDTPELSKLKAISTDQMQEIEKILQIRHLYAHRNGIVDESFLVHFRGQYALNTEHQQSVAEVINKMDYLLVVVALIDEKAADKYGLSRKDP